VFRYIPEMEEPALEKQADKMLAGIRIGSDIQADNLDLPLQMLLQIPLPAFHLLHQHNLVHIAAAL
jgi:hypothetical protein